MKKSIKSRLTYSFMLIIIITVGILLMVITNVIKEYYYKGLENELTSKIEYSMDLYSRYYSTLTLDDILIDDIDIFGPSNDIQIQILSLEGDLLMDSLGVLNSEPILTNDVIKAMDSNTGVWIGNVEYDSFPVMATSMVLKGYGEPIGIVRFISSLEETNKTIKKVTILLSLIAVNVVLISGFVSVFLADTIVKPLVEVTGVAEQMADGQLKIRSKVKLDDEIGRLSATLNYMASEILKRDQIKNDFISSISHELRTPLTSIKGWAITLQSDEIRDEELLRDGLKIIEEESDRLSHMVEDLLDFSRFISGRINLEKDIFDLDSVLIMLTKQYLPRTKEKKLELQLKLDDKPKEILGDENRIKQVVINLLDNSIKFTKEQGRIILSAYKEDNSTVIAVEDTGIGIPEEDLPHIKDKFYKGKDSMSHSGIGLSICDEIIKLHGGDLIIESELGKGTLVKVILPSREVIQ